MTNPSIILKSEIRVVEVLRLHWLVLVPVPVPHGTFFRIVDNVFGPWPAHVYFIATRKVWGWWLLLSCKASELDYGEHTR